MSWWSAGETPQQSTVSSWCRKATASRSPIVVRRVTRPNPINRESVLELEREGRSRTLLPSNVTRLEGRGRQGPGSLSGSRARCARRGSDRLRPRRDETPENFLKAAGIAFDGPEPKLTDSFATSVAGLFLAGDLTAGRQGGSIILAFNTAAAAMRRICENYGICAMDRPSRG